MHFSIRVHLTVLSFFSFVAVGEKLLRLEVAQLIQNKNLMATL